MGRAGGSGGGKMETTAFEHQIKIKKLEVGKKKVRSTNWCLQNGQGHVECSTGNTDNGILVTMYDVGQVWGISG